eukprot:4305398-Lingulodinium_polyedra.AAC.1
MLSGEVQAVMAAASEVEEVWASLCDGATEVRFDAMAFNTALMKCGCELTLEEQSKCLAELSVDADECMSKIRFVELLRACGVAVAETPVNVGAEASKASTAGGVRTKRGD